ncbi:MAG: hypothetical protein MUQ25_17115 [Candidatus Aminicenantes bacterium]|nr:hypothetical protein [Candidatus Aminicenantes bacterium]
MGNQRDLVTVFEELRGQLSADPRGFPIEGHGFVYFPVFPSGRGHDPERCRLFEVPDPFLQLERGFSPARVLPSLDDRGFNSGDLDLSLVTLQAQAYFDGELMIIRVGDTFAQPLGEFDFFQYLIIGKPLSSERGEGHVVMKSDGQDFLDPLRGQVQNRVEIDFRINPIEQFVLHVDDDRGFFLAE